MNTGSAKNIITEGFNGGGKTFFIKYIVIYTCSKGLTVVTDAMMCHKAIQLGRCHWYKSLCIPIDCGNKMSVY